MTIVEQFTEFWNSALQTASMFVIPDWGALVALLPIFIFIGVIGPFLTFTVLGALYYQVRKPRVKLAFEEGPRLAELDAGGEPIFPAGLPYLPARRDRLPVGDAALRDLPRRAERDLPDVRPGSDGRRGHVRQLRPRPARQDPRRRRSGNARTQAGRGGRGLTGRAAKPVTPSTRLRVTDG